MTDRNIPHIVLEEIIIIRRILKLTNSVVISIPMVNIRQERRSHLSKIRSCEKKERK